VPLDRADHDGGVPTLTEPVASTFDSFGALLRFLRRRARLTQRELGLQVGYSEGHICRLEQNTRLPEPSVLAALFVPALRLDRDPPAAMRLLELAKRARGSGPAHQVDEEPREALDVPPIPAPPPHAVTRPEALAALRAMLAAERVVVVCGLAGTGKTTLAATLAREEAAGGLVCWITLTPGLTASPEALIRQLARHLASLGEANLGRLLEPGGDAPPLPLDQQLDLLAATLARRPTLICLDNGQALAGDEAGLGALGHLAAAGRARLLVCSREPLALAGAATFRLGGLDRRQAVELITRLDPDMPAALAERLTARTAGSPMLLRLALGQARQGSTDRGVLVEHLPTNPEVAAYLLHTTLDRLGPAAEKLICLLSVFREPVDLHDPALAEQSQAVEGPYDVLAALDELRRRQLVDHPAAAALHPLVRDHVYARLVGDLGRRRRLHRIAANWYEQARDHPLEAAWHFSQGGDRGYAAEVLAARVRSLIDRGHALPAAELVADLLARSRRGGGMESVRRLLVLSGDLLANTARAADAEAAYREALAASGPPAVYASVAVRLAGSLLQRGQVRDALAMSVEAAERLGAGETLLLAKLAASQAAARLMLSEHDEALLAGRHALDLAAEVAAMAPELAAEVESVAHAVVGILSRLRKRDDEAVDHFRRAIAAARLIGAHHRAARGMFNLGAMWVDRGELAEGRKVLEDAAAQFRLTGDSYALGRVLHALATVHHYRGELAEAVELFDEACALKRQVGDVQGLATSEHSRALTLRTLGRVDEALEVLERVVTSPAGHAEPWARASYLDSYATALLIAGRVGEAVAPLREALDLARSTGGMFEPMIELHLAMALLVTGEPELAEELAARPLPGDRVTLEARCEARLLRAMVAVSRGDTAAVLAAADEIARWMATTGFQTYRGVAARLVTAAAAPPPLAELPALMLRHG
jgi:tetratricopeptide (TPR) repeat protein/transcriptional regulator with XRE-family HTH domain